MLPTMHNDRQHDSQPHTGTQLLRKVVPKHPIFSIRVTRSTFCQGAKSCPETAKKEPNSKTRGQKIANHFSKVISSYKTKSNELSNLLNGNVPQSQLWLISKTSRST